MHQVMVNKVFLFNPYACNRTDGGPSGVIAQNLLGHSLPNVGINPVVIESETIIDRIRKRCLPPPVPHIYHDWFLRCAKIYRDFSVARYRAVFFHDVFSLRCCLHLIPPSQKVILQSHSPQLPHEEVAQNLPSLADVVTWVCKVEADAFARANFVVFPNVGAAEIYRPLLSDDSRILYLSTGSAEVAESGRIDLDPSCCNLLFIGRRNTVKGFDLVLDAFRRVNRLRPELRLYVVGRGAPITEPGVVDIGFSDKPHLWMRSCHYLINFNRQSYLDLSILEALSVGTRIIMTTTHGHAEFAGLASDGLVSVEDPAVTALCNVLLSDELMSRKSDVPSSANIDFYRSRYTDKLYRARLDDLARNVLEGRAA